MAATVTYWIGVLGTWAYSRDGKLDKDWRRASGPFDQMMRRESLEQYWSDELQFNWTGDLDGIALVKDGNDWEAGGDELAVRLTCVPFECRNLVLHSHGGPIGLRAALRVPVRNVLTIGTPAHRTTRTWGAEAMRRGNIKRWRHVSDRKWDTWGFLGAVFDGRIGLRRAFPFVDRRMNLPGVVDSELDAISHTKLLDGTHGDLMRAEGLFDFLKAV